MNDLRILQPSLPLKNQENKYLNKPPTINSDRTWGVFFQTSEWASFKRCCGRHLWPLFHSTAPRMVIALISADSLGALCLDGCFLFSSNNGVPMVTQHASVSNADNCHASAPLFPLEEAKPVRLKGESSHPQGF